MNGKFIRIDFTEEVWCVTLKIKHCWTYECIRYWAQVMSNAFKISTDGVIIKLTGYFILQNKSLLNYLII